MGVGIPPGYGQASLKFLVAGSSENIVTTIGYQHSTGASAGDTVSENADAIWTAVKGVTGSPLFNNNISSSYTFVGVDVQENRAGVTEFGSHIAPYIGTQAHAPVPVNSAVLVRKVTARGGRKGRGRMFFPPLWMTEAEVTPAGVLLASKITEIQGWLNNWLAAQTTAGLPLVLLHDWVTEPTDFTPGVADPANIITALQPQILLATQRRRMR